MGSEMCIRDRFCKEAVNLGFVNLANKGLTRSRITMDQFRMDMRLANDPRAKTEYRYSSYLTPDHFSEMEAKRCHEAVINFFSCIYNDETISSFRREPREAEPEWNMPAALNHLRIEGVNDTPDRIILQRAADGLDLAIPGAVAAAENDDEAAAEDAAEENNAMSEEENAAEN